jgi:hypothetical protein
MPKQKTLLPNVLPLKTLLGNEYTLYCNNNKVYNASSSEPAKHVFLTVEELIYKVIISPRDNYDWRIMYEDKTGRINFYFNKYLKMFIQK